MGIPFGRTAQIPTGESDCTYFLQSADPSIRRSRKRGGSNGSQGSAQPISPGCVQRGPALPFLTFDHSNVAEGRLKENQIGRQSTLLPVDVYVHFHVWRESPQRRLTARSRTSHPLKRTINLYSTNATARSLGSTTRISLRSMTKI
jgi:hypothetical protein